MRSLILFLASCLLAAGTTAIAQPAGRVGSESTIIVTGRKDSHGKKIEMSDWHVAETNHVLVYSKGDADDLTRIAYNLERLHFLLSVLFNRVDEPDDTVKLSVTMIGDGADFDHLELHNIRWQQGPYPRQFPDELYYDPREDGAVLATTLDDQKIVLQHGINLMSLDGRDANGQPITSGPGVPLRPDVNVNEVAYAMTAEGRLYAGFARHYLMTYFPNAYPRWYLEGFGEMFATFYAASPSEIDYGQRPEGFSDVMHRYGRVPVRDILQGKYLDGKPSTTAWTPYHAWALVHLLFFSEEWQQPLHKYLEAVARGASEAEAEAALGDVDKLQKELAAYRGRKVPYEKLTYPPERTPPPAVRRLLASEAALVRGRLELGARVEIPPAPPPGADSKTAARMERDRTEALAERQSWLDRLRNNALEYPKEASGQLLLAEAECRSDNAEQCLAAADRALSLMPKSHDALAWKGIALAKLAIAGPAAEREKKLRAARKLIVKANRTDPEAIQPLLAYYRSFSESGETPPQAAVAGLMKVVDSVPAAPAPRLMLGSNLARLGDTDGAKRMLRPIAIGAYDSPEKPAAEAILDNLPPQTPGGRQPLGR